MAIYTLEDKRTSILLIGGSRHTAEMAIRLRDHEIPFNIYLSLDDAHLFAYGDAPALPPHLIPFSSMIVTNVSDVIIPPDIIMDCQPLAAELKVPLIHEVLEEFPSAIILCSTLACTATEIMHYIQDSHPVIGFGFLPGHTGTASVIELAKGLNVSEHALKSIEMLMNAMGYTCEIVEDRVGLVIPRILATLMNEAAFAVLEQIATKEDIDAAMKTGVNYPHGLLEWADTIGLDTVLSMLDALYAEYRQERYRPCILFRQYVRARWIGKAGGKGFYTYASGFA
ncbi:MAG: 3-hydroxyacyl-CoA dehydrogenase family protein [Candidatus Kapaibacteriota bacterium]